MTPLWRSGFAIGEDNVRLFYETCSSGPPILLFDGLFCRGHVWKYFTPYFCGQYQLVHWHYPGHGKSSSPSVVGDVSVSRLSRDALAIMDLLNLEDAILVGHSLGVQVVLEMAFRYPSRVRGMVLLCGAPGQVVRTFHDSRAMSTLLPLLGVGTRFVPRQVSSLWGVLPMNLIAKLVRRSDEINKRLINMEDLKPYFEGMAKTDINVATRILEQADHHDMMPMLSQIFSPALVVAGEKDRFTPSYRSREMADALPNAELLISDVGTHSLPLEQPDLVNLAIDEFFEQLS